MQMTYFLAQVMGLYVLIVGLTMLFWKKRWMHVIHELCQSHSQTINYVLGMVALPFGILLVLVHNYWNSGVLALVVTLFGWVILLKSILVFVVSPEDMGRLFKNSGLEKGWYVYVVIVLIIGSYLTYRGFGY